MALPVLSAHQANYGNRPSSTISDGECAGKANAEKGKEMGLKHAAFHKLAGVSYQDMGVKLKTLKQSRDFGAGVEGTISEFERAFGATKEKVQGHDGFDVFVWP